MKKQLRIAFAAVSLVGGVGAVGYMDRSHPHGLTSPYHETYDAVAKAGTATEAQKQILVQAAIQSNDDTRTANKFAAVLAVGLIGGAVTRRRK